MKIESSFQPLSFWAQGPWVFFNLGLKFMQTWQEECFSRLRLMPGVTAPLAKAEVKAPLAAAPGNELATLAAEIAARQGRETALLGCLQNVKVVGGPVAEPVAETVVKAVVEPAQKAEAKPATPVKKVAEKAVAKPLVELAPPETPVALAPENAAALEEAVVESAMPSVTSMLAMQAKSLAKAVKTAPPPVVAGKKTAAKSVAKTAVPAPAKAAVKAKPVASKKA